MVGIVLRMKKVTLDNATLNGQLFHTLTVITDDDQNVLLLPLLYAVHLEKIGTTFRYRQRKDDDGQEYKELTEEMLGENSIHTYFSHIFRFHSYLNALSNQVKNVSTHQVYKCDSDFVNDYLNYFLVENGVKSIDGHRAALSSYFNFLSYLGICHSLELTIYRKSNQRAAELDETRNVIKYISSEHRHLLQIACKSKAERLILKMGSEVGLRAAENCGLLLNKRNESKVNNGLQSLFDQMALDDNKSQNKFRYHLQGKYAKNGRPREIYFSRELLLAIKDYVETERKDMVDVNDYQHDLLFVRSDIGCEGLPISTWHASNVFSNRKASIPGLDQDLTYHALRHTFATELYHQNLLDKDGRETRSESAALLNVAIRLGHKLEKEGGKAPSTTTVYIRLLEEMKSIEGITS